MEVNDIQVGIVVSFKGSDIKAHMPPIRELTRKYGEPSELPDEGRPYVCTGKQNGLSQWAEVTTEVREERLHIPKDARTWQDGDTHHSPKVRWKREEQWVHGAVFEGPDDVWANLATDANTSGNFRCVIQPMRQQIRAHLEPQLEDPLFPLP